MDTTDFDELAGRIEGIAQAVLHLSAAMEIEGIIDGPQLSQSWRRSVSDQSAEADAMRKTAQRTLSELSQALDAARTIRHLRYRLCESRSHQIGVSADEDGAIPSHFAVH